MTNIELKSKISEFNAERVYARNRAEECYENNDNTGGQIWEEIEIAYTDLIRIMERFLIVLQNPKD